MLFSTKERLLLLNVLPQTSGSVIFVRIIRQFREDLSFSEEESLALKFVLDGANTSWTDDGSEKEIECGPQVLDYIKRGLLALDAQERVTEDLLPLFDRFAA